MITKTQAVEIFHLLFLLHLEKKIDRNLYSLKGGCNLRFFFKSIRYSEDIDFDVQIISKNTLLNKIDKIIESRPFLLNLKAKGIEIVQSSKPKQTETTQRWKLLLKVQGLALEIPTKIEFSRRSMKQDIVFQPVDIDIIRKYNLYPVMTNHYSLQAALNQKIFALINRSETQARDIFDIKLLIDQGAKIEKVSISDQSNNALNEILAQAVDRILSVKFEDFKTQVVAFLMEEYQSYSNSEFFWKDMQESIIKKINDTTEK